MAEQTTYRFKYVNHDLDDYLNAMRSRAEELRRQAATLRAQADTIDEERNKLSLELLPVEETTGES